MVGGMASISGTVLFLYASVLSRVVHAYRISLGVAILSVLLALVIGGPLGLIAGYAEGWPDQLIMRPLDVLNAVIARNMAENADKIPAQDSHEIHFAIGTGRIGGQPATVRCQTSTYRSKPGRLQNVSSATDNRPVPGARHRGGHPP